MAIICRLCRHTAASSLRLAYSRRSRKSHRDCPPAKAGCGVDHLRSAISQEVTARVCEQVWLNIGKVERTVVKGVVAVRIALRCRSSTHSNAEENQCSRCQKSELLRLPPLAATARASVTPRPRVLAS